MTRMFNDPLLGFARLALTFIMGVLIFAMAAIAIAVPVLGIWHKEVTGALVADGAPANAIWLIIALIAMTGGMLYLAFLFMRNMKRIVDSVAEGDPFNPVNAARLTRMAWQMLAIQIAAIPLAITAVYLTRLTEGSESDTLHGFDVNGIVLVLTLFILARVFRKGAEMREELEGTV